MAEITETEQCISIRIADSRGLRDLLELIDKAPAVTGKCLLIDYSSQTNGDPSEHALLGEHMASVRKNAKRIAIVAHEDAVTYNSERVAQRRRVDLRVFTDRLNAERWFASEQAS